MYIVHASCSPLLQLNLLGRLAATLAAAAPAFLCLLSECPGPSGALSFVAAFAADMHSCCFLRSFAATSVAAAIGDDAASLQNSCNLSATQ